MVTEAKSALEKLSEVERAAVHDFLMQVHATHGRQVRQAMLFGSKARGEATGDSDIDVLLIVTDETWQLRDEICAISADVSLKHDVLLDERVIGAARWEYMSEIRAGLYLSIVNDAVPLTI
jgi:predicted nucleotidyltransferase